MSKPQYSSSSSSRNSTYTTPFCKVCADAGLPSSSYTSHYVKDQPGPNGRIVCPTLITQACRVCGERGHTSSYCDVLKERRKYNSSTYQDRQHHNNRRGEEEEEKKYNQRQPRISSSSGGSRHQDRDISFNRLEEDTQRHERDVAERTQKYYHEQNRQSKPWLQAALKQPHQTPYAHPHGPRVRIELESRALSASVGAASSASLIDLNLPKWGTPEYFRLFQTDDSKSSSIPAPTPPTPPTATPAIDVRKVELHHAANWGDEDTETPFVCDPEKMMLEFAQSFVTESRVTDEEFDFIKACDNDDNENCFPEEA